MPLTSECRWFVAHTLPRCEKKLQAHCVRQGMDVTLPCYPSAHKYRGKTVIFQKPLFPGYVFIRADRSKVTSLSRQEHLAHLLEVHDQVLLEKQLSEIMQALTAGSEVRLAPDIGEGQKVRIKSGPLRGIEGWVEKRHGPDVILLRLDFINQAAAVQVEAGLLERI
jgi:transcription antitermination factor NusG